MRTNPAFAMEDLNQVKELIRENPWARMITHVPGAGLVASHYPVILEEHTTGENPGDDQQDAGIVLVSHMGRPDDTRHQVGEHPMMMIVEGPHGYISPSWYKTSPHAPTWDFVTVHLHGTPEVLSPEDNLAMLDRLVDHCERDAPEPFALLGSAENAAYAERIVHGTLGFRMRVTSWEAKEKMHQGAPVQNVRRVMAELRGSGPYANPALAERIERANRGRLS